MKKSFKKRNAKKSVKKNAKKRFFTRKIKQRGGVNSFELFLCICVTIIAVLYYNHVPTMKVPNIDKQFKNPTKYNTCLVENNEQTDPFTYCENKPDIYKNDVDRSIMKKGFGKCLSDRGEKIEKDVNNGNIKLVKNYDVTDYAVRLCYNEGVETYNQNEKQKHAENCAINVATSPYVDSDCFPNMYKFYYEDKVSIIKDTTTNIDAINIYSANVPGYKIPTDVIGNPKIGYFSTESVVIKDLGITNKEITSIFDHVQKVVHRKMPEYSQNVFFVKDGKDNIIRYADINNPNAPILEFHYFDSEIFENLREEHLRKLPE